ncbi:MAG: aminodeoxychorismate/anthranilate synthase component II [Planctomycetes bacterium]|nr:aminodeoxychorismate/anthranilate synthase component II [Planctomycetota bacterium]
MILVIDNYDSFTFNLVQALGALSARVRTERNDRITVDDVERLKPARIVISPGPKTPAEAGVSVEIIRRFAGRLPILGVCLGHQSIAEAFGAKVIRAARPVHGKTSLVHHDGAGVYRNLPNPFRAMRYHSLIVEESSLPEDLEVTARTDDREIMGLRHRRFPLEGVQFHPESYQTPVGMKLLENFLSL